jgi:hypothetical protein
MPVEGSGGTGAEIDADAMHIIHVTAEMAPIAKVGGLGDVVTGLARSVLARGHDVSVIMPYYSSLPTDQIEGLRHEMDLDVPKVCACVCLCHLPASFLPASCQLPATSQPINQLPPPPRECAWTARCRWGCSRRACTAGVSLACRRTSSAQPTGTRATSSAAAASTGGRTTSARPTCTCAERRSSSSRGPG